MRMAKIKQKAKDESENEVKQQVADYLIKAGYTLYRINNAPVAFKRFHGKKGVSDTIAFKPGEYALALEGKATGKKPSDEQKEFLELVNTSKGIVGFHYDSLDRFLQLYIAFKPGEYALALEGKATGKKPSDEQKEFLELVNTSKDRFLQLYNDIKNGYGLPTDGQTVDNGIVHIYEQYAHHTDVFIMGDIRGLESLRNAITLAIDKNSKQHTVDVFCNDGEGYTIKIKVISDTNILPAPYTADYAKEHTNVSLIDIWTMR